MKLVKRTALAAVAVVVLGAAAVSVVEWVNGYRAYILHTGSMVPTLRPGYVVIDRPVGGVVHTGEIITFRYRPGPAGVVMHRVWSDRSGAIRTKGDANPTPDPWVIHPSQIVGTPIAIIPVAGYALVYLRQPAGAASIATLTLDLFLLWGLCFDGARGGDQPRRRPAHRRRPATPGPPAGAAEVTTPETLVRLMAEIGGMSWPVSRRASPFREGPSATLVRASARHLPVLDAILFLGERPSRPRAAPSRRRRRSPTAP